MSTTIINKRIKNIIRILLPYSLYAFCSKWIIVIKEKYIFITLPKKQKKALARLKSKAVVRCVFFAIYDSNWKFDSLYRAMLAHPRFEPIILVCPVVNYGKRHMLDTMDQCYKSFFNKGYNVKWAYNKTEGTYVDVKKELHPDIIFYTNPYHGLIDNRFYITNFTDTLTAYTPYGFNSTLVNKQIYDQLLNNLVWRLFTESDEHKSIYKQAMRNNGKNCVVTGYTGIDELIDKKYIPLNTYWHRDNRKHIIWAPHHTIAPSGMISFSCFMRYCDFMIEMAKKYQEQIQIIFKPHPLLLERLKIAWGEDKAMGYYEEWKKMPNTALSDGEYVDLFLTSDAMIHDSGSFLLEYLYVKKPVMRTMNGEDMSKVLNDLAMDALDVYYQAYNENDIENFIRDVINGVDTLANKRDTFVKSRLMPPNKKMASENVLDDIVDSIDNQILYRN